MNDVNNDRRDVFLRRPSSLVTNRKSLIHSQNMNEIIFMKTSYGIFGDMFEICVGWSSINNVAHNISE